MRKKDCTIFVNYENLMNSNQVFFTSKIDFKFNPFMFTWNFLPFNHVWPYTLPISTLQYCLVFLCKFHPITIFLITSFLFWFSTFFSCWSITKISSKYQIIRLGTMAMHIFVCLCNSHNVSFKMPNRFSMRNQLHLCLLLYKISKMFFFPSLCNVMSHDKMG
jgi:hypothetical protein